MTGPTFYVQPTGAHAKTDPDGVPLGGAWVPVADWYTAYGSGQTAMTEDNDRAPYAAPPAGFPWHLLAVVGLVVLVAAAMFTTDRGDF